MMTFENAIKRIQEFASLFAFEYNGKDGDIDPFNKNKFNLFYNGETKEVHSIEDVINEPFFDGKSFKEIYDEISIVEY